MDALHCAKTLTTGAAGCCRRAGKQGSKHEKEKSKERWKEIARFPNPLSSQVGTLSRGYRLQAGKQAGKRKEQCGRRGKGFQDEGGKVCETGVLKERKS